MRSSENEVPEPAKVIIRANKKREIAFNTYDKGQNKISTWVTQQDF